MSDKYSVVKKYYRTGLWSIERVRNSVAKSWITAEEFKEITGEEYTSAGKSTDGTLTQSLE